MVKKARKKIVVYALDRFGKNFEYQEKTHQNIKEITIKNKDTLKIRIDFYLDIKEYRIIGQQDAKLHKIIKLYLKELGWL